MQHLEFLTEKILLFTRLTRLFLWTHIIAIQFNVMVELSHSMRQSIWPTLWYPCLIVGYFDWFPVSLGRAPNWTALQVVFLHSWHFAAVVYKNAYLSFVNSLLCCVSIGANNKWINLRVPILKKCPKMHPNLFQTIFKMHALSCCVTIDVCDKSVH